MKRILSILVLTALVGCVTSPSGTQTISPLVVAGTELLVCVGAQAAVVNNPQLRADFTAGEELLSAMIADGNYDPQRLVAALDRCGIKELNSGTGQVLIGPVVTIWGSFSGQVIALDNSGTVKALATAMRNGLRCAALAPPDRSDSARSDSGSRAVGPVRVKHIEIAKTEGGYKLTLVAGNYRKLVVSANTYKTPEAATAAAYRLFDKSIPVEVK